MLMLICFRNNANVVVPPTVSAVSKKEPQENIARIAKRYLDDNMQQAWINPRLISMVSEYINTMIMLRTRTRAPIHTHNTSWPARARVYIHVGRKGLHARVFSEQANKLVCSGLPHWESFVINLLGGNARTLYIPATEVETRRVSNLSGLFLRFLVRESGAIYNVGYTVRDLSSRISDSAGIFTARRRKMSLRYRITRRSIWNMAAASWRQIFMTLWRGLQRISFQTTLRFCDK